MARSCGANRGVSCIVITYAIRAKSYRLHYVWQLHKQATPSQHIGLSAMTWSSNLNVHRDCACQAPYALTVSSEKSHGRLTLISGTGMPHT